MNILDSVIWAIQPEYAARMIRMLENGPVAQATQSRPQSGKEQPTVGVVPIRGLISRRESLWTKLFGGATIESLSAQLQELADNPSVKTIVLDIDSPGGSVAGIPELGGEILRLRSRKPVIAVANDLMASAAYWLVAQASEIVATPSSLVGSIGIFALHIDQSRALDMAGIKPTFIQFGENKTLGNPLEPLSERAREEAQKIVDEHGRMFVRAVADGRRTTLANVQDDFGQGLAFMPKEALRLGMIDRIGTMDEVLQGLGIESRRSALRKDITRAALTNR